MKPLFLPILHQLGTLFYPIQQQMGLQTSSILDSVNWDLYPILHHSDLEAPLTEELTNLLSTHTHIHKQAFDKKMSESITHTLNLFHPETNKPFSLPIYASSTRPQLGPPQTWSHSSEERWRTPPPPHTTVAPPTPSHPSSRPSRAPRQTRWEIIATYRELVLR